VGDPWQGKGVGRKLLEKSLRAGKDRGIGTVHGTVLADNAQMLNLAREMGFTVARGEDAHEYRLSINLEGCEP
jgi:acetyltransferase